MFVGIDLGTSALKGVAIDDDGSVRAVARCGYPTSRPELGAAEQDPDAWWSALDVVIGELSGAVPVGSWAGIGLSGMLPTLVELDQEGRVLAPAITWEDSRAESQATALCGRIGEGTLYRITGQRLDGRYLAPMHARLDELGRGGAVVAGAKDVLFKYLTGELLTDPSTAAGTGVFDIDRGAWDPDLVAASGIPALPDVAAAGTALPVLRDWCTRRGLPRDLPVVLGAADSVLGALGVGATEPGDVAVIAGTSAIVLGICADAVRDPHRRYLVTPLTGVGWGLEMDLLAMGSAFDWIARLMGVDGPGALLELAATVPAAEAPLFLPYLAPGEQGALWDPDLTGVLQGLRLGMGRGHLARALLTGVVVELRRCLSVLGNASARRGPILLGGGSAVSPLLWQDLADATGREVHVDPSVTNHSAIGAAVFAARALTDVNIGSAGSTHRVTPCRDAGPGWADIADRHDELRTAQRKRGNSEPG